MHPEDPSAADAAAEGPSSGSEENGSASKPDADAKPRGTKKRAARKKRARRRKRASTRPKADATQAADAAEAPGGAEAPPALDADAGDGTDAESKPRRKRRKRRKTKTRARKAAPKARSDAADEGASGAGDEDGDADDARARRRRRRRKRLAAKGKLAEGDREAASGEATEDEGEPSGRKRRRRRRKAKSKDKAESRTAKTEGKKSRRRRKEARRKDERRDRRRGRDGRRDGRRDRRLRDPRAVDIVPKPDDYGDEPMEKILLVNASDREEARIALLVNGRLEEVYIEALRERSAAGNIYRGRVQNVEIGIGAAFVDLGRGVTGFLHASDMPLKEDEEPGASVTDRLHPGDEVIVQITRDGIGRKGPALTGRISLPGRYLVLMPFTSRSGISRRIPRGPERERMRKLVKQLEVPEGMGVIVRTASETTDLAALQADLTHLASEWERIRVRAAEPGQPGVLRGESDIAERSVRDIMPSDVTRIVVDKEQTAGRIHQLLRIWYPSETAAAAEAGHLSIRMAAAEAETPVGELRAPGGDEAEDAANDDDAPVGRRGLRELPEPGAEEAPEEEAAEETVDAPDAEDAEAPVADETETESEEAAADADAEADDDAPADALEDDDEDAEAEEDEDGDEDEDEEEETPEGRAEREARLEERRRLAKIIPEVLIHTDPMPLFHAYDAETQLEDAFRRALRLPSGGSIVIDPTEALVAVDVNSGRLTDEIDPETTALKTNLEAVGEIARQLRLRDLGGLVVLDFIDMRERKSRREVEKALHESLSRDRARIRVGRMGPFGCVILSRQRIRQALTRVTHEACETCGGTGRRRVTAGLGLRVLHEMQARVARSRGRGGLEVRAPQPVVEWINRHRSSLVKQIKKACGGPVTLSIDSRLAVDGWAMKGTPPTPKKSEGDE